MTERVIQPGSDEDLMLRYAGGDADAFQALYENHRGGLYRYFLRQSNPSVAEELFQDVWARVISSRKHYRPTAAFNTWLYTLAHNRLIDHWRREGRSPVEAGDADEAQQLITDGRPGPQRLADLRDCLEQLLQLVAALPDVQRQAFLLRHEAGMSLAEIAGAMSSGAETAKSRLRYAMQRLRSAIAQECLEG
ncbi:MAG: sigma-70 family RNA polymerase sigma factor [Gammaproteobacteria bacterium]